MGGGFNPGTAPCTFPAGTSAGLPLFASASEPWGATARPTTNEAISVIVPTTTTHEPTIAPAVTRVRRTSVRLSIGASPMMRSFSGSLDVVVDVHLLPFSVQRDGQVIGGAQARV